MQAEKYKIPINMHACKDGTQTHTRTDARAHWQTHTHTAQTHTQRHCRDKSGWSPMIHALFFSEVELQKH